MLLISSAVTHAGSYDVSCCQLYHKIVQFIPETTDVDMHLNCEKETPLGHQSVMKCSELPHVGHIQGGVGHIQGAP